MTRRYACRQVKSVLSKILLCRTAALKGRLHRCRTCGTEVNLYNSCADRHCPQCGGARRADWLDNTAKLLLPRVNYFQVVFTLPSELSSLALGNRRSLYHLLFASAWRALDSELRRTGKFQPAALMVLHTWNQELDHHPHLHVLAPAGGPSPDGRRWVCPRHPRQRRRRKPWLTDRDELADAFRREYVKGLRRLLEQGRLRLDHREQRRLASQASREAWMERLAAKSWNVYIEGPPHAESRPDHVLKYLARYMTGGPIASGRIIDCDEGRVTFWARSRDRANKPRPFALPSHEFVRRWSMHILPHGFTRTRSYGGYHPAKRSAYLERCADLLPAGQAGEPQTPPADALLDDCERDRTCPNCRDEMTLVAEQPRPSWRQVFTVHVYENPASYCPLLHLSQPRQSRAPPSRHGDAPHQ